MLAPMTRKTGFVLFVLCVAIGFVLAACGGGSGTYGGTGAEGATGSGYHHGPTGVSGATGASGSTGAAGPVALSQSQLETQASTLGEPIYWAGPQKAAHYEYTRLRQKVWIRYLPEGVTVNQKPGQLLIVGTYPLPDAYDALKKLTTGRTMAGPNGSLLWLGPDNPKSVYIAWPGVSYEVEVYDPIPAKALSIAKSGQVAPVS